MKAWKRCAACPELVPSGTYCKTCESRRNSDRWAKQNHYSSPGHRRRFRKRVLERDPICVNCHTSPSTDADHYPHTREELERQGFDPNDPQHGRGLCKPCHSRHTATEQRGGWANQT